MNYLIECIIAACLSLFMYFNGYGFSTWQYWVVLIIMFLEFQLLEHKWNEDLAMIDLDEEFEKIQRKLSAMTSQEFDDMLDKCGITQIKETINLEPKNMAYKEN